MTGKGWSSLIPGGKKSRATTKVSVCNIDILCIDKINILHIDTCIDTLVVARLFSHPVSTTDRIESI